MKSNEKSKLRINELFEYFNDKFVDGEILKKERKENEILMYG